MGLSPKHLSSPADTPLGEHVVQAEGISVDGSPRAVAAGVFVSSLGADADGDGVNDADEIASGSDPFDASSVPTAEPVPLGSALLRALMFFGIALLAILSLRRRMAL